MDTELKPSVSFLKKSKSRKSVDGSSEEEDEGEDVDYDNEDTYLIKKSKRLAKYKQNSSPYYGSSELNSFADRQGHRNVNTPVYDPTQDEEYETLGVSKITTQLSKLCSCPKLPKHPLFKAPNILLSKLSKFLQKYSTYFGTIKQLVLFAYFIVCFVLFSLNEDASDKWTQTVISNKSLTRFSCESHSSHASAYYRLKLNGPFISLEDLSRREINSGKYVNVNVYSSRLAESTSSNVNNDAILAKTWQLVIKLPDDAKHVNSSNSENEYSDNMIVVKNFELNEEMINDHLEFVVDTNEKDSLAFTYNCEKLSPQFEYSIVYAATLLVFVYVLIMFELTHRTLAAFLGSLGGLAVLSMIDMERPSLLTVVTWVEWETILLMFGMMIIVNVFCETGLFDLIAFRIFHYSGSRIWVMISSLCLLSALLSAFLDNVTTILLLTPITIRLCEVMSLDARFIIIAEVIFSNIGGVSTAIGDPPNVIITANQVISERGVDFANFTAHMFIGAVFIYATTFLQYRLLFLNSACFVKTRETEVEEMRKEITIWTRTYQNITPITKEEKIVKTLLKEKVGQLEALLSQRLQKSVKEREQTLQLKSQEMIENYRIHDTKLLIICSTIFSIALILFFLHPFLKTFHLTVGWIAALSALVLLVTSLGNTHANSQSGHDGTTKPASFDFEAVLHKVEWATLLFFAGLFVFMRSIEELGLLTFLANHISDLIKSVDDKSDRLVFALLMLILLSALISSLIDNIPFTTAMIPIIIQLSEQADASCNLVAAGIAEQHGIKITFNEFFKTGFPIMINSVLVAIIYMCITSVYFEWY